MWIYIIAIILILLIIYTFVMYNSFVKLNNKVKEAFSTMDVYLKQRWDLIPNIVEVVKGYADYEKETLNEIIELRSTSYDDMNANDKLMNNEKLAKDITKLMAVMEAYPDLKANEHFMELNNKLVSVENDIANSRKYYNAVIKLFNNKVETFPNNIFAKMFGYKSKDMFAINDSERENIKVEL